MKKILALVIAALISLSAAGCTVVSLTTSDGGVLGKGDIVELEFPCEEFTKLIILTTARIHYQKDDSFSVKIAMHENLRDYLTATCRGGELIIDSSKTINVSGSSRMPDVYIAAPSLEYLTIAGFAEIADFDRVAVDSFTFNSTGVANGELSLSADYLSVTISGAGNIRLNGTADKAAINSMGIGNINAFGLDIGEAEVTIAGAGNVEISCSKALNAKINGLGGINYKGNPTVVEDRNGLGRVTKAD